MTLEQVIAIADNHESLGGCPACFYDPEKAEACDRYVLARKIRKVAGEHRPTMQGSCTTCFDPDGCPVKWPCETIIDLEAA